ncbi:hypothetical protein A9168_06305 [Macellibacteroides sp. HH-ZS]|nr:hypothetical protein A9168_06305 [Macellibacteroides sp. HH-ZS]
MDNRFTNYDRMLQTVLSNEKLIAYGEYNVANYETIDQALNADNPIVVAVAKIINGLRRNSSENEIYNEVSSYLKNNIL